MALGTLEFTDTGTEISVEAIGWALSASPGAAVFTKTIEYPG